MIWNERRKRVVMNACAIISGKTNWCGRERARVSYESTRRRRRSEGGGGALG